MKTTGNDLEELTRFIYALLETNKLVISDTKWSDKRSNNQKGANTKYSLISYDKNSVKALMPFDELSQLPKGASRTKIYQIKSMRSQKANDQTAFPQFT